MFRSVVALIAALGFVLSGVPAKADVPVPSGFLVLCMKQPAECRGGGAAQVMLTDSLRGTLDAVNASVNASIKPKRETGPDVWQTGVKQGDCEEYVLAKRRALIRAGVPASSLRIVYALRNGGGHAVLGVNTDQGVLVLDNMSKKIKPLRSTGYKIVSMSGPDPRVWHRP